MGREGREEGFREGYKKHGDMGGRLGGGGDKGIVGGGGIGEEDEV